MIAIHDIEEINQEVKSCKSLISLFETEGRNVCMTKNNCYGLEKLKPSNSIKKKKRNYKDICLVVLYKLRGFIESLENLIIKMKVLKQRNRQTDAQCGFKNVL